VQPTNRVSASASVARLTYVMAVLLVFGRAQCGVRTGDRQTPECRGVSGRRQDAGVGRRARAVDAREVLQELPACRFP